jgi:hypothetical protein
MKKTSCIIIALLAVSCASGPNANSQIVANGVPAAVKKAVMEAPKDVIVGIGAARMATMPMSMTMAETRARVEIAKQINSMVDHMVIKYTDGSGTSPDDKVLFTETITRTISNANVDGSTVIARFQASDGYWWCVVSIPREKVADQINHARTEAVITVPSMGSFKIEGFFDEALVENSKYVLGSDAVQRQ